MFIIYGLKTKISHVTSSAVKCRKCNDLVATVSLKRYFHIFFVPFFPVPSRDKHACVACGHEMPLRSFQPTEQNQLKPKCKGERKYHLGHYTGLVTVCLLFIAQAIKPMLN